MFGRRQRKKMNHDDVKPMKEKMENEYRILEHPLLLESDEIS
jgi:hypothetical protein